MLKNRLSTSRNFPEYIPSARQKKFLSVLFEDEAIVSITGACEKIGMSRRNFYYWLESEGFRNWFKGEREKRALTWGVFVDRALIKKCMAGDGNSLRLWYERFDDLKQKFGVDWEVRRNAVESMDDEELKKIIDDFYLTYKPQAEMTEEGKQKIRELAENLHSEGGLKIIYPSGRRLNAVEHKLESEKIEMAQPTERNPGTERPAPEVQKPAPERNTERIRTVADWKDDDDEEDGRWLGAR